MKSLNSALLNCTNEKVWVEQTKISFGPPTYGFLSARWLTVEHLIEHVGLGLVQKAIKSWEARLAACGSAKLEALLEEAATERDQERV